MEDFEAMSRRLREEVDRRMVLLRADIDRQVAEKIAEQKAKRRALPPLKRFLAWLVEG